MSVCDLGAVQRLTGETCPDGDHLRSFQPAAHRSLDQAAGALRKLTTFEAAKNTSESAMHAASSY